MLCTLRPHIEWKLFCVAHFIHWVIYTIQANWRMHIWLANLFWYALYSNCSARNPNARISKIQRDTIVYLYVAWFSRNGHEVTGLTVSFVVVTFRDVKKEKREWEQKRKRKRKRDGVRHWEGEVEICHEKRVNFEWSVKFLFHRGQMC